MARAADGSGAAEIPFRISDTRAVIDPPRPQIAVAPANVTTRMPRFAAVSPDGSRVVFETLGRLYIRDVAFYHFPGKHVLRTIVLGGEFPYWSPYISAGQPLAANPVHKVFYPLTWLILLPLFLAAIMFGQAYFALTTGSDFEHRVMIGEDVNTEASSAPDAEEKEMAEEALHNDEVKGNGFEILGTYLLGRWADVKQSLEELVARAKAMWIFKIKADYRDTIKTYTRHFNEVDGDADKKFGMTKMPAPTTDIMDFPGNDHDLAF